MDVFVYGTLTESDRAASVLETFEYLDSAALHGLRRVEGTYPTLAPGGRVHGRLLRTGEIASLDRYEGVERGLYARVSVPLEGSATATDDANKSVAVYVGDPVALSAEGISWPGSGPFTERVERFIETESVRVRRA